MADKAAQIATVKGAIETDRTSLIGTFGTTKERYALVRMTSGRIKKVKPGTRLDGGEVVTVGEAELHIQHRGRVITLNMPHS